MADPYAVPSYLACGECGYVMWAEYDHPGQVRAQCRNCVCSEYEKEVLVSVPKAKTIRKAYVD